MITSGKKISIAINLLILLVLTGCQWSCDSSSTSSDHIFGNVGDYYIAGGITKDINDDLAMINAELLRNDSTLGTALIKYGSDTLIFIDPYYKRGKSPALLYPTGLTVVQVKDSAFFDVSFNNIMPDIFSISSVIPDRREKLSSEIVQLTWTGSANAEGYLIAAVKRGLAYTGVGYSQYVAGTGTQATFDTEAFTVDNNPSNEIDTGLYNLYVYAFYGSPDSNLTFEYLPVPLPNQLADNVEVSKLDGHFGSVVISLADSMRVLTE